MALITCKECNGSLSDKALVCPHCGAPADTQLDRPAISKHISSGTTLPKRTSFWETDTGYTTRWLLFLPVGLLLAAIAQPALLLAFTFNPKTDANSSWLLNLVSYFLPTVEFFFWLGAAIVIGNLACGVIAPERRRGATIFSIVVGLLALINLGYVLINPAANLRDLGDYLLIIGYHLVFAGALILASFRGQP